MKVLISADMEGTAGVIEWKQVMPPDLITRGTPAPAEYDMARRLMTAEVNAAIRGAKAAGATEIIVNDSHDGMRNLIPADLDPDAWLITGNQKPLVMVCEVDQDVDALVYTGYHASAGTQNGVLAHSFTLWIMDIWIGDLHVGEHGMNAAAAGHWDVPVVAVTGDEAAVVQTKSIVGDACAGAIVKYGKGWHSARHMHPSKACELIEATVKDGVSRAKEIPPLKPPFPTTVTVRLDTSDRADKMQKVPGTNRVDGFTVSYEATDGKHLMEHFLAMMGCAG